MKTFKNILTTFILVAIIIANIFIGSSIRVYSDLYYLINLDEYIFELNYKDGFKIMQLADIQANCLEEVESSFVNIDKVVYKEKPDLIALTGDFLWHTTSSKVINSLISNLDKYNIAWCPIFGNHDIEEFFPYRLTKQMYANYFAKAKNCLFNKGPESIHGVGNYVVNLVENNKINYSLFFMDSNNSRYYGNRLRYDYIYKDQIDWYSYSIEHITQKNNNTKVNSAVFMHIPLMEYADAIDAYYQNKIEGWGTFLDGVSSPEINTGMFDKILELGSTEAVICGHDHNNTGDLLYKGVHLCFGLKSSLNAYHNEALQGVSVYTITNQKISMQNIYF